MIDKPSPDEMSVENQFEYLIWMKERLFELIKINFFIITAVAAVAPFVVKYTDVVISDFTNSRSMILGAVGWMATLFLLVFLLFTIRPASSVEKAPVDLYESYKPLESAHSLPMSLHLLSNLMNVTTTTTIGSGLLLFIGIFEAWTTDIYDFTAFLTIIMLVLFLSVLTIIIVYLFTIFATAIRSMYKSMKYSIIINVHGALLFFLDIVGLRHVYIGNISILGWLVLESARDSSLQTINDISIDVGYNYEQVEQEVEYLDKKGLLIEAKLDQYSLTRKGYAALRRHTADVS